MKLGGVMEEKNALDLSHGEIAWRTALMLRTLLVFGKSDWEEIMLFFFPSLNNFLNDQPAVLTLFPQRSW